MPENLLPCDGETRLFENAIDIQRGRRLLETLRRDVCWRQEHAQIMGRRFPIPRLQAWYGDAGYVYSGIHNPPQPWIAPLLELKAVAEGIAGREFNSVLVNLYRNGRDSVSWHADNEPSLGPNPVIVSFSLGATRRFHMRHKRQRLRLHIDLPHASCLLMAGSTQHHWLHQLPKSQRVDAPRINLTFRGVRSCNDTSNSSHLSRPHGPRASGGQLPWIV